VTLDQARADLQNVIASLANSHPDTDRDRELRLDAFRSGVGGPIVALFAAMTGAFAFVLLIACANVANLLPARAAARGHEVSVRMSIGASRGRVVRQLLVESLLLAACATLLGLALSAAAIRIFWAVASESHPPYWLQFPIDWRVFTYLAAICLATTLLFGLVPALYTVKTNVRNADARLYGRQARSALVRGVGDRTTGADHGVAERCRRHGSKHPDVIDHGSWRRYGRARSLAARSTVTCVQHA
jgi:ABC-type antimicrobial peptide transport system permease subunit